MIPKIVSLTYYYVTLPLPLPLISLLGTFFLLELGFFFLIWNAGLGSGGQWYGGGLLSFSLFLYVCIYEYLRNKI